MTYYIGGLMEKVTRGTGPTEYRHLIPAGSASVVLTRRSDATTSTYYATSDHLGSGDLILSSTATVLAKESFTPFGARRGSNWQGIPTTADYTAFSNTTRRGFTGHEMLDSVSLVHMNGRVYDPTIGRFLQADPIIQTIAISQALNPYSYVMNIPLALIDPSGYSWLSHLASSVGNLLKHAAHSATFRYFLSLAVVAAMPYLAPGLFESYGGTMLLAAIQQGIASGNLRGAGNGAISAAISNETGVPIKVAPLSAHHAAAGDGANGNNQAASRPTALPHVSSAERYATSVESLTGKPYRLGANGPNAYDCSSTVCYGIRTVSRTFGDYTADQIYRKFITPLSGRSSLRRGDLIFYDYTSDGRIDHVATVLSQDKMLHASSGAGLLQVQPLDYLDDFTRKSGGTIYYGRIDWEAVEP